MLSVHLKAPRTSLDGDEQASLGYKGCCICCEPASPHICIHDVLADTQMPGHHDLRPLPPSPGMLQDDTVWNMVLPADVEDELEALHMEGFRC